MPAMVAASGVVISCQPLSHSLQSNDDKSTFIIARIAFADRPCYQHLQRKYEHQQTIAYPSADLLFSIYNLFTILHAIFWL